MNPTNEQLISRRQLLRESLKAGLALGVLPSLLLNSGNISAAPEPVQKIRIKSSIEKSWRKASTLEKTELADLNMDLTPWDNTPRNARYPYVAAKLAPPYTAAEIIYMLTVGQYFPWWTHESPLGGMMINNRGGINYYTGQREFWSALTPDTLTDYLYQWPEDKIYSWAWDRLYTPARYRCDKLLQNAYRTGLKQQKYSGKWTYSNSSQKTTPEGEALYCDKYWNRDFTYGDAVMVPWYYTWRFLGTDTLYEDEVVRFPETRKKISIRGWDEKPRTRSTASVRIMGDDYPAYTSDRGVPCYVLEGMENPEFVTLKFPRIILWVDMHALREIRRERYDRDLNLAAVIESRNRLELKDRGKWGYSNLIHLSWNIQTDHMSVNHFDFHRPPKTFKVDPDNPEAYFRPNPVAMCSQMFPVPESAMVFRDPEEFYLRPKLMADKFPEDRKIKVEAQLLNRIESQERENRLVFP
jgi:hypothetical protein